MSKINVFQSVGSVSSKKQDAFVKAIEYKVRSEGFEPMTVGRNIFSDESPLKAVNKLMGDCSGTIVIALERIYFPEGIEHRNGPNETTHKEIKLPTAWNQVEKQCLMQKAYQ